MSETSSQNSSRASSLLKHGRQNKDMLLQTHAFIMIRACCAEYPVMLIVCGMIMELAQTLAFALNPMVAGHRTTWSIFYAAQVPFWDSNFATGVDFATFLPMYWAVVGPVITVIFIFALGLQFPHFIATNVLGAGFNHLVNFLLTPFFVPTLQTLLTMLSCAEDKTTGDRRSWLHSEKLCSDPTVALHFGISTGVIAVFLFLALVFKACTYTSSSFARDPRSSAHGSLDLLSGLYKAGVCIAFHLMLHRGMASYYSFLVGFGALVLSALYGLVLPFYSRRMNQLYCVAYAVVAFAAFVVFIDSRRNTFSYVQNGGFYATLALGGLMVAFLANKLAQLRYSATTDKLLLAATTPEFVPLEENPFARAALAGNPDMMPFPKGLPESDYVFSPFRNIETDLVEERMTHQHETVENLLHQYASLVQVVSPTIEAVHFSTDAEVAIRFLQSWVFLTESDPTAHMLSFACRILAKNMMKFPASPMAIVHFLRFLIDTVPSLSRMNVAVALMESTSSSMFCTVADSFQMYLLGLSVKESLGIRDKSNSSLFRQTRRAHKTALIQSASIWQNLVEEEGKNLVSLCFFSNTLSDGRSECFDYYSHAIKVMPKDEVLYRNFGSFVERVCYNKDVGQICAEEATRISGRRKDSLQGRSGRAAAAESEKGGGGQRSVISATTAKNSSVSSVTVAYTVRKALDTQMDTLAVNLSTSFLYRSTLVTFGLLILVIAGVAAVTIGTSVAHKQSTGRMHNVGNLRTFALRSTAVLRALGNSIGSEQEGLLLQELKLTVNTVESSANAFMFGEFMSKDPVIVASVSNQDVLLADPAQHGLYYEPASVWDATQTFVATMLNVIHAVEHRQFANHADFFAFPDVAFLTRNKVSWPVIFTRLMDSTADGESKVTEDNVVVIAVVLALAVAAILGVGFLIMVNFRRAASTKVKTLHLFTLIPKESLRSLVRDAKAAVQQFISGGAAPGLDDKRDPLDLMVPSAAVGGVTGTVDAAQQGTGFEEGRKMSVKLLSHLLGAGKLTETPGKDPAGNSLSDPFAATGPLDSSKKEPEKTAVAAAPKKGGPEFAPDTVDVAASSPKAARRRVSISLTAATKQHDALASSGKRGLGDSDTRSSILGMSTMSDDPDGDMIEEDHEEEEHGAVKKPPVDPQAVFRISSKNFLIVVGSFFVFLAAFAISVSGVTATNKLIDDLKTLLGVLQQVDKVQRDLFFHQSGAIQTVFTHSADGAKDFFETRSEALLALEDLRVLSTSDVDAKDLASFIANVNRILLLCVIGTSLAVGPVRAPSVHPAYQAPVWYPLPRTRVLESRYKKLVEDYDTQWVKYGRSAADMALPEEQRQELAKQVMFDRFAWADFSELQESMRVLVGTIVGNATIKVEAVQTTGTSFFLAAGVLWFLSFAVTIATAFSFHDVQRGLRKFLYVSALVALAAGIVSFAMYGNLHLYTKEQVRAITTFGDKLSPVQHGLTYTMASIGYLFDSGKQQFFKDFLYESDGHTMVITEGFISASPAGVLQAQRTQFRNYINARAAFLNLACIYSVLAMQSYGNTLLNVTGRINHITWNLHAEEDTYRHLLLHPSDAGRLYANTTHDAALPPAEKLALARRIAASHKWKDLVAEFVDTNLILTDSIAAVYTKWASDQQATFQSSAQVLQVLAYVCLAISVVTVLYVALVGVESCTITEDEQQLYDAFYSSISNRAVGAILLLAAVMVAVCVLSITYQEENGESVKLLGKVSDLSMIVYRSSFILEEFARLSTVVSEQLRAQRELQRMLFSESSILENILFNSKSSEVLRKSHNAFIFGEQTSFTTRVNLSSTDCYSPENSVDGNTQPLVMLYVGYTRILQEIATFDIGNMSKSVLEDGVINPELNLLVQRAKKAAAIASKKLLENEELFKKALLARQNEQLVIIVIVIIIGALIATVAVLKIIWPAVKQLTDRELGLKLLLTSLPVDIQTAAPGIQDFYTVLDSEADLMKKKLLQSEKLLQNILPPVVSRRLKNGERIIADTHPDVTVVFAALIGFDEYSKTMEARQIVHFLNGLIVTFDHIVDLLDLEKIKTIGDVYFLCGGLTAKTSTDHPLRCMECALLFFDAIHDNNVRQNTPNLTLRAGINTDPAVAGVIGSKKVAYDLWGDSVNTSSRMQSTGIGGKIQVSDKTYRLIKEYYSFTDRSVSAKGKGELKTHMYSARLKPTPYSGINWRVAR